MFKIKIFIFLLLCLFVFLLFYFFRSRPVDKTEFQESLLTKIKISNIEIEVEPVISDHKQYLGLSNRESISDNFGMLFLFPDKRARSFVMRDMNFTLDIVFINENEIVGIYKNLPFDQKNQEKIYNSPMPVDKVLELKGGFCDLHKISVGDFLSF